MTPSEKRLWAVLRRKNLLGLRFRRQQPVAGFIVDFYCAPAKLVIELDGESHVGKEGYDSTRIVRLKELGFTVIRVWDTEVFGNMDGLMQHIYEECKASSPLPLPPPSRGGGKQQTSCDATES